MKLFGSRRSDAAADTLAYPTGSETAGPLLACRGVDVCYDKVQVLFGVDLEVHQGEIVALLGTNGAGKSTLLRAISGLTPASNGAIFFDGEDITFLPPSAHAASSIDWIARLASDTANRVLSVATTTASGAWAVYDPLLASDPRRRRVFLSRTTMKCQGCRFIPLPVRRAASTIRRTTSSGIGLSW